MNTYKLILKYKGTNYFGWQIQSGTNQKTIQGELNRSLAKLCSNREKSFLSLGSGRTDAGVHAVGQVVKVQIDFYLESTGLKDALNSLLPPVIQIIHAQEIHEDFHPIFHTTSKEYRYYFSTEKRDPFKEELLTYFNRSLDLELMNKACEMLIGGHDFMNYFCTGTPVKTTYREIYKCFIMQSTQDELLAGSYYLKIEGNGFLKQMVRLLMGTLFNIGLKRVSLDEFSKSLTSKIPNKLAAVAPPQGLYLYKVYY